MEIAERQVFSVPQQWGRVKKEDAAKTHVWKLKDCTVRYAWLCYAKDTAVVEVNHRRNCELEKAHSSFKPAIPAERLEGIAIFSL